VCRLFEGMAIILGLMANFVNNLFIDVSLGRTPLLYYDFSRVPLYRSNHRISAVKGLEHEEDFSASRIPKRSVARNIATTGIDN
jgi:hypothetical protein